MESNALLIGGHDGRRPQSSFINPGHVDWRRYKSTIIDLYIDQDKTLKEVMAIMQKRYNLKATDRQYLYQLSGWGLAKRSTKAQKDQECDEIFNILLENGDGISHYSARQLRKLQRYCKTADARTKFSKEKHQLLLWALDRHLTPRSAEDDDDVIKYTKNTAEHDDVPSNETKRDSRHATDKTQTVEPTVYSKDNTTREVRLFRRCASPDTAATTQEQCLILVRELYGALLKEHIAAYDRSRNILTSSKSVHHPFTTGPKQSAYNAFWHDLQTGIYLLKADVIIGKDSHNLAIPLLQKIDDKAARQVFSQRPISLLKDVFLTISPANLNVWAAGHKTLLALFVSVLSRQDAFQNLLLQLFSHLLKRADVSNDFYESLLSCMLEDAVLNLSPDDPELFQLRWAFVKFLRQVRKYAKAQSICTSLITAAEHYSGKDSSKTRQAMSEMIYIHSRQKNYHLAEEVATDVLLRGRRDLGSSFPDAQCIYSMEDIAEVLQFRQGNDNLQRSAKWLRLAHQNAVKLWTAEEPATKHIFEKLETLKHQRVESM